MVLVNPLPSARNTVEAVSNAQLIGLALAVIIVAAGVTAAIKILDEYERGVIFPLGRLQQLKGPGLIVIIPIRPNGPGEPADPDL